MRNDHHGLARGAVAQRAQNGAFGLDVHAGQRVVQHDDGRAGQQGARQRQPLFLPARQRHPPFADHGPIPVGKLGDLGIDAGQAGRPTHIVEVDVGPGKRDVVLNPGGEQERVLGNEADAAPQFGQGEVARVAPVDRDGAARHVEQPRQELHQRALARPHPPDDGHGPAGGDTERHVVQGVGGVRRRGGRRGAVSVGRVPKVDVPEFERAAHRTAERAAGAIDDVGTGLPDRIQAQHGCLAALVQRDQPAHGHRRPRQQMEIAHERDEVAQAQLAGDDLRSAGPQHDQQPGPGHAFHQRRKQAAHARECDVLVPETPVEAGEHAVLPLGPHVGADDVHAADGFLHAARQVGQPGLHRQRAFHQPAAHAFDEQEQQRIRGQGQQGQDGIDRQHVGHAVHVVQRGIEDVDDPQAEQQAHRGHVVDQPRHEVADGPALIVAQRQGLQVGEQFVTQPIFDVAAGVEDQEPRKAAHDALHDGDADDEQQGARDLAGRAPVLDAVHRLLEQQRDPHRQRRGDDQTRDAARIPIPILIDVAPQPSHASRASLGRGHSPDKCGPVQRAASRKMLGVSRLKSPRSARLTILRHDSTFRLPSTDPGTKLKALQAQGPSHPQVR